jgi:hypothetical protein
MARPTLSTISMCIVNCTTSKQRVPYVIIVERLSKETVSETSFRKFIIHSLTPQKIQPLMRWAESGVIHTFNASAVSSTCLIWKGQNLWILMENPFVEDALRNCLLT